jgi:hypothetical protein
MLRLMSAVSLSLMFLVSAAQAQFGDRDRFGNRGRDLVPLGERLVEFRVDRDVINIGQSEDWYRNRAFRSLVFRAERNDVYMIGVRVVYLNGYAEDFRVDRLIQQGSELTVDLRGDRSFLRQIEMTYRSRPDFRGQALVKVFGELTRRAAPVGPVSNDWVPLGERLVEFRTDRDVINIGQSEDWYRNRSFRALHFIAERNDVFMIGVRIVYLNGFGEDFRVDRMIPQGGELAVDLRGDRSFLRQIEMTYRSRPDFRGQALVKVFGEPGRRFGGGPGGGDNWVELGCQQVNLFGQDRDTITVGRREGRFKAIRLSARDADVEMLDLKVIYANGDPDDIPVRNFIRAGERTRSLGLQGSERSIDRIEMTYRSAINPVNIIAQQRLSMATVCVEGLQ